MRVFEVANNLEHEDDESELKHKSKKIKVHKMIGHDRMMYQ